MTRLPSRRAWASLALLATGLAAGCTSSGEGAPAAPATDAGPADAAPPADAGCAPPGYERGACCEAGDGPGVCVPEGCATTPAAPPQFDELCLGLCGEQCAIGETLGPCCVLTDPPGAGICDGDQCRGASGREPNALCARLAALPAELGCGRRITGTPLDAPCTRDEECDLDLRCVDDGSSPSRYCAPGCGGAGATCPAWFACVEGLCVRAGRVGQGCMTSESCQSGQCVRVEGDIQYCTVSCDAQTPCPEGLACDAANELCLLGMGE